ncbi:DUF4435 domain-containing protein [Pseudomonas sp. TTU2014-080ASC]|uniref:DUF4435 domain-containing protein n=1 Tax=Pseudomonas sp. TTU2014-080ASC TaxID=1729724 RepID=UPI00071875ED|nr:DUF4435 domain-containing protein [Pseudomonas sp. TTU2014-080ASC]KRW58507.1 hypothetical protein AO726_16835 [Pseudomonas sp. TTU2014-080ASC]
MQADVDLQYIPARGVDGAAALDIFYTDFNEVFFYFEDEDQENLYDEIIRKILPDIKMARVFPLQGKSSVLKHASAEENSERSSQSIYVLDKDFDDLLNKKHTKSNIFYLDRYCIENYLIDEPAIAKVIIETYPKAKINDIESSINIDEIINNHNLIHLFKLFYCVQKLELGLKNCSKKCDHFTETKKRWILDKGKINEYEQEVLNKALELKRHPKLTDIQSDFRLKLPDQYSIHELVSGKFLLGLVFSYIKSKYSLGAISLDSFTYRIAKNCDLRSLTQLSISIRTFLKLQTANQTWSDL